MGIGLRRLLEAERQGHALAEGRQGLEQGEFLGRQLGETVQPEATQARARGIRRP